MIFCSMNAPEDGLISSIRCKPGAKTWHRGNQSSCRTKFQAFITRLNPSQLAVIQAVSHVLANTNE